MRNFKVTVNGTTYDVAVEETGSAIAAETPVVAAPATPAAAPAPAPAPKAAPVGDGTPPVSYTHLTLPTTERV